MRFSYEILWSSLQVINIMDTKKLRDLTDTQKSLAIFLTNEFPLVWDSFFNTFPPQKGLFIPTLNFLELSIHQTVDFPEQGEPQKGLPLGVHANPFFFQGTEEGSEKLSLERVLFPLNANSVIKVRSITISMKCYPYFSPSLKALWPLSGPEREARALLASHSLEPLGTGLPEAAGYEEPLLSLALSAEAGQVEEIRVLRVCWSRAWTKPGMGYSSDTPRRPRSGAS